MSKSSGVGFNPKSHTQAFVNNFPREFVKAFVVTFGCKKDNLAKLVQEDIPVLGQGVEDFLRSSGVIERLRTEL
jgi:hypothetical protein